MTHLQVIRRPILVLDLWITLETFQLLSARLSNKTKIWKTTVLKGLKCQQISGFIFFNENFRKSKDFIS